MYGETPYIQHEAENGYKRLFFSDPGLAFLKDITISPGFGVLKAGTLMAINKSAAGNVNKYVPYNPTIPAIGDANQKGRAFLVSNPSTVNYVYVTQEDSYKFKVADDLIIGDSGTSCENLGAITAIDRTTYVNMAKITFTATISGTFTASESAWVAVEAGTASNGYSDVVGILGASVDTGVGEKAKGALAPMIIKNAMLYYGLLTNIDAASLAVLGSHNGNFLVM
jgi:hypothetical protein